MNIMILHPLVGVIEKARELSQRKGNHGKVVRLFLEELLREGITVSTKPVSQLLFASAVHSAKTACRMIADKLEPSAFEVSLSVGEVDRERFAFRICITLARAPQSMRERQAVLGELVARLEYVELMLYGCTPESDREVLFGDDAEDLTDEELDAECTRLSQAFDRLLAQEFEALGNESLPARLLALVCELDIRACYAYLGHVSRVRPGSVRLFADRI